MDDGASVPYSALLHHRLAVEEDLTMANKRSLPETAALKTVLRLPDPPSSS